MKKVNIVYSTIGLLIFFSFYVWVMKPSDQSQDFIRSLDAEPEMFERIFETDDTAFHTTSLTDTTEIFTPATVRLFNNKVYVSDFTSFTIFEYDLEGNLTGKTETGRGNGPGEFQNLTDFDVIGDTLWAVDIQNLMIHSFSVKTGEFIKNISTEHRPVRITCLADGFIVQWLGSELLFSKFDYQGNELFQFGEIIENQIQHVLSLTGTIRSNSENRFVYIPSYASLIYHYDGNGELINILKAPDGMEFPATRREGATSFAPGFVFQRDGFLDENNKLFVYTGFPGDRNSNGEWTEGEPWSSVDKYDLVSGKYIKSIKLPGRYSSAMYNPKNQFLYGADFEKSYIHQWNEKIDF